MVVSRQPLWRDVALVNIALVCLKVCLRASDVDLRSATLIVAVSTPFHSTGSKVHRLQRLNWSPYSRQNILTCSLIRPFTPCVCECYVYNMLLQRLRKIYFSVVSPFQPRDREQFVRNGVSRSYFLTTRKPITGRLLQSGEAKLFQSIIQGCLHRQKGTRTMNLSSFDQNFIWWL